MKTLRREKMDESVLGLRRFTEAEWRLMTLVEWQVLGRMTTLYSRVGGWVPR